MKEYVVIYVVPPWGGDHALFVRKNKPSWQKGFLNLPGGAVEPGETPEQAAIRELEEETGYKPSRHLNQPVKQMGIMEDIDSVIYCFAIAIDSMEEPKPRAGETETFHWISWNSVRNDKRLLPSVRLILPLMMNLVYDWKVVFNNSLMKTDRASLTIIFPGENNGFVDNPYVTAILEK